jgi:putative transposase
MRRRRNAQEAARVLREADHDLGNGLTISDICRTQGFAEAIYYRWRKQHDPKRVDTDRRCRELEREVDRLKSLVAELVLDKHMLQAVAKKVVTTTQQRAAADFLSEHYGVSQRRVRRVMARARAPGRFPARRGAFPQERRRNRAVSWQMRE